MAIQEVAAAGGPGIEFNARAGVHVDGEGLGRSGGLWRTPVVKGVGKSLYGGWGGSQQTWLRAADAVKMPHVDFRNLIRVMLAIMLSESTGRDLKKVIFHRTFSPTLCISFYSRMTTGPCRA